jgi:hypothetical protein
MAEETKDHQVIVNKKDELSDQDLNQASGGTRVGRQDDAERPDMKMGNHPDKERPEIQRLGR